MAPGPYAPGAGRFYGAASDLIFRRLPCGTASEHFVMTFRSRILWLAGLIALAAAFGLLPQGHAQDRTPNAIPKAPAFRL